MAQLEHDGSYMPTRKLYNFVYSPKLHRKHGSMAVPSTHVGKKYTVEKIDDGKYRQWIKSGEWDNGGTTLEKELMQVV